MRRSNLPLGEWFTSLTRKTGFAVMCRLSTPCSIYPVYAHGGSGGVHHCVLLDVTMIDDIIYRGLSPVGNLKNQRPSWGRYHHLSCMTNDPTSPVGREPMTHMIHRSTYYACIRTLVNCVVSILWRPDYWCSQLNTHISELSGRSE